VTLFIKNNARVLRTSVEEGKFVIHLINLIWWNKLVLFYLNNNNNNNNNNNI